MTGPLIAVACSRTADTYCCAVSSVGGRPRLVQAGDEHDIRAALAEASGLLISGGPDIDPTIYGEQKLFESVRTDRQRDELDRWMLDEALKRDIPILGICRGLQTLTVFLGGSLYQDIPCQVPAALPHKQEAPRAEPTHEVIVEENTLLAGIVGAGALWVNTFHHQAAKDVPPGFRVSARVSDGVIEAIEATDGGFRLGVQWHPEDLCHIPEHRALFEAFVAAAR